MNSYDRSIKGAISRANGEQFEKMIMAAAAFYESKGISVIDKTPEPMRVLRPYDRKKGQFVCCFSKQAQPDFKGVLEDATMVLFDAKHTDRDRISRGVVTQEQEECFERYTKLGAMCFLVVSIGFRRYYRVQWIIFRNMSAIFGHRYMNEEELRPYRIYYKDGVLRFLDGIELRERTGHESAEV
jgi:penicillin-binding protein-related factor A (putative recombinase)